MDEGDAEDSAEQAREAEKYLRMADERLAQEQRSYENLEREEALYRIERELARCEEEQKAILDRTMKSWSERTPDGGFTRFQRIGMRGLADEQQKLQKSLDPVVEAVRGEGSEVFGPTLRTVVDDMGLSEERIRRYEPDDVCQGIQRDVIARLHELSDVFREQREAMRNRNEEQQGDQGQQGEQQQPNGQGKPPIVAKVAEIRALKRRQESVTKELDRLRTEGMPDDSAQLTPYQRSRLERLAHEQGTIRQMWRDLAHGLGIDDGEFASTTEAAPPELPPSGGDEKEKR